jgi:periplasmic copper chaperone A
MSHTAISRRIRSASLLAILIGTAVLFGRPAHAAAPLSVPRSGVTLVADDGISVPEAWARASAGPASTGAAYITLKGGSRPDQLVAASTPVAASAEVHETTGDNGVMKMRPVPAVPIPPGQTVTFTPGGTHIMLMGLKKPLTAGQSFPLTLTFTHAAPVTVEVKVRPLGGGSSGMKGDSMGSHDGMPMR